MVRGEPGKPRGKMTAYAFFVQTFRAEHKRERPNETVVFAEFSKKCAAKWKQMDGTGKRPYEDMAARDKLRWVEEMKHYTPPDGRKGKKQKRKKDPNAPKRPMTAFFLFCADRRDGLRQQYPDDRIGDIAKKLGHAWAACDPRAKSQYEATAASQKADYQKAMDAYKRGTYQPAQAQQQQVQQQQMSHHQQQPVQHHQAPDYDEDDDSEEEESE